MSKHVFISKSGLLGVFAKYAVQQSPYHRPDNLEVVLDRLNENITPLFEDEPLGVREFEDWQEIERHLAVATELIPEFQAWNDRKNGHEEPSLAFTSRYDAPGDPDDDFIDLEALWRNVSVEVSRDATDISSSESSGEPPTLRKLAPVSPNTNIEINGQDFELVPHALALNNETVYSLKPVKKTEKKSYCLYFDLNLDDQDMQNGLVWKELDLTPTTADKLSEAISALVEYVQVPINKVSDAHYDVEDKALEARKSFQESQ